MTTKLPDTAVRSDSRQSLEYHRLSAAWRNPRWWKPLLGLILSAVIWAGMFLALVAVVMLAYPDADILDTALDDPMDMTRELDFAVGFLTLALMLPAILLGFRLVGCVPIGLLSSVAGRLRWRLMLRCLLPVAIAFSVTAAAMVAFDLGESDAVSTQPVSWVWILLALLLIPLQATAEEYVFRGGLMQTVGAWLKHPAWAILLPVPLFVIGHAYDLSGQTGILLFAIAMGWITWRTGGLEAAIVIHVINNLAVFGLGAVGITDLNQTEISWGLTATSVLPVVLSVIWIDRQEKRQLPTNSLASDSPPTSSS